MYGVESLGTHTDTQTNYCHPCGRLMRYLLYSVTIIPRFHCNIFYLFWVKKSTAVEIADLPVGALWLTGTHAALITKHTNSLATTPSPEKSIIVSLIRKFTARHDR